VTLAIDLFAGAGGASLGLHRAGFAVYGVDKWEVACRTHEAAGFPTRCADLNTIDWSTFLRHEVPFLWASPPCQPFSAAGSGRGHADERDGMPAFLRAVEHLRPSVVVMENVKGLTFAKHRWYLDAAVARLAEFGYAVEWRVLNTADYGVPQTRERLFLIGRRDGGPIVWPEPTHARDARGIVGPAPWITAAEALGEGEWPEWFYHRPSTTIAGDPRVFVPGGHHANDGRRAGFPGRSQHATRLDPHHHAVLQGFPADYPFVGRRPEVHMQIGNAVPPPMAEAIGRALLPTLKP
jgi:DNA (cytosine-5)-methyltransferase 1